MKKMFNSINEFFKKYEAIITVVLGVIFVPIAVAAMYLFVTTPLALEELGFMGIENFDIYNPVHIIYETAAIGAFALMWWVVGYVLDFASAVNALVHGKKSRKEVKENDI